MKTSTVVGSIFTLWVAAALGTMLAEATFEREFERRTSWSIEEVYKAADKCENKHGDNSCMMVGVFIDKDWEPTIPSYDMQVEEQTEL